MGFLLKTGCILLLLLWQPCFVISQKNKVYYSLSEALKNPEQVYHLELRKKSLSSLPPDIGKLVNLETLILEKNYLKALPPEIGQLKNLKILDADQNSLTAIPAEIGNLILLEELDLDQNYIRALPSSIGNLVNLKSLDIHSNNLTSLPREIGNLTKLTEIIFTANRIDSLPVEFQNLENITTLVIDKVKYIPAIGKMQKLTSLSIYEGGMKTLPEDLGELKNLKTLKIYNTQVKKLPDGFGKLTQLTELILSYNQLDSLPADIGNLVLLTRLDAKHNRLTTLPGSIGKLKQLQYLGLKGNLLTTLPDEICGLTELNDLEVSENKLTSLPLDFYRLSKIKYLSLSNNQFTRLPAEIGKCTQLTYLNVSDNKLTSLPEEIGQLVNVTSLHLKNNQLKELPAGTGKMKSLKILHAEYNSLTTIPSSMKDLSSLTELHIHHNKITTLPAETGFIPSLALLDASHNQLTTLPAEIGKLNLLIRIYLQNNKLTTLPVEIGTLTSLNELHLDSNKITSLPATIGQMKELNTLEINYNLLPGLPAELGRMPQLSSLSVMGNPFSTTLDPLAGAKELSFLLMSEKHLKLLPLEMINHPQLIAIELGNEKTIELKYLTQILIENSSFPPEKKKEMRRQLWADKIIREIISHSSVLYWDEPGTKSFALLYGLKSAHSTEQLTALCNDTSSLYLRLYAFRALEEQNYPGIYTVIREHMFDDDFVMEDKYTDDDITAGDIYTSSRLLTAAQKKETDSLLLYTDNNLLRTKHLLRELKPEERHHQRIYELAETSMEALHLLAEYGDEKDSVRLRNCMIKKHYDPDDITSIIEKHHFSYLKPVLDSLIVKKSNYYSGFAGAMASYRDEYALNYFKNQFELNEGSGWKRQITDFEGMSEYPCPLYDKLLFELAEKYPAYITNKLFDYLKTRDIYRSTELAKSTLSKLHKEIPKEVTENYIRHLAIYDFNALGDTIAGIFSKAEKEQYVSISFDGIHYRVEPEKDYHHSYSDFTDYNRKYTNVSFFVDQAHCFKSEKTAIAMLSFMKNIGANLKEITSCILSYNEPEWNRQLIAILAEKRNLYYSIDDEIKELLEEYGWLEEMKKLTKIYPVNPTGSWDIISYTTEKGETKTAPYFAKLELTASSYRHLHCSDWHIGKYTTEKPNAIQFDSVAEYEYVNKNTPGLALSAPQPRFSYCTGIKDMSVVTDYDHYLTEILSSVTRYELKDSTLTLYGEGKSVVKLKLNNSWYPDWRKPVSTYSGNGLPNFPIDTGIVIRSKPQIINGKPLSYYLAHPQIDSVSKLFITQKLALTYGSGRQDRMADSLLTKNPETFSYYIYQFHRMMEAAKSNGYYEYVVRDELSNACAKFFLQDPGRFFTLIKYGTYKKYFNDWQYLVKDALWDTKSEYYMKESIRLTIYNNCPLFINDWNKMLEWIENYVEPHAGRG